MSVSHWRSTTVVIISNIIQLYKEIIIVLYYFSIGKAITFLATTCHFLIILTSTLFIHHSCFHYLSFWFGKIPNSSLFHWLRFLEGVLRTELQFWWFTNSAENKQDYFLQHSNCVVLVNRFEQLQILWRQNRHTSWWSSCFFLTKICSELPYLFW